MKLLVFSVLLSAAQAASPDGWEASYALDRVQANTQATASDARTVSSELHSRRLGEHAQISGTTVFKDATATEGVVPVSDQAGREAETQAGFAGAAEKQASAAVYTAEQGKNKAPDVGSEVASKEVHDKLGDLFKEFEDWRFAVKHNPEWEARKAAQKAEQPYVDAMMKTEKRIEDLDARAQGLSAQASNLRNTAQAVANGAVMKQAGLDLTGAQADMMNAHQMIAQANEFDAQAGDLGLSAKILQINIPAYQQAAQMAYDYTGHRYSPGSRPPPPVNPIAFTPPPPPTNVFLQRARGKRSSR